MKQLIVCGDIHLTEKEPKKTQALLFLDWFFNQEFNNSENQLILLGDLVESLDFTPELLEIYLDYFLNKSKFEKILILQGNHDCNIISSLLSVFKPLKNVEVITSLQKKIDYFGLNLLFLPHYKFENTNLPKMSEYYSNLKLEETFDFCFHHVFDSTEPFSECDLSNLKVKQYLCGHDHLCNIQKGGHYLGSPVLNSKAESGKVPYIATISVQNKDFKLIEVPKFLEYFEIEYPKSLENINTQLGLFTINNSLDKKETLDFYQKQAKEKNIGFYPLNVISKKVKENDLITLQETSVKDEKKLFENYCQNNKINDIIQELCLEVIDKKLSGGKGNV